MTVGPAVLVRSDPVVLRRTPTGRPRIDFEAATPLEPFDNWYVSTAGTSGNLGTEASPWSLTYAASGAGGQIGSDDIVWIAGGTYTQDVAFTGTGVTFRGSPGGLPVIDGAITGASVTLRDLHQTDSSTDRTVARNDTSFTGSCSVVNCSFLDGQGIFAQGASLIHGCITLNQGYEADTVDRGHAHGIYAQNSTGVQAVLSKNILGPGYGWGLHVYTSSGVIDDFLYEGNAVALSGLLANEASDFPDVRYGSLIGGDPPANRHVIRRHYAYEGSFDTAYELQSNVDLTVDGTRGDASGSPVILNTANWTPYTLDSAVTADPGTDEVYIEGNDYELGRANIIVFNPSLASTVSVDLSTVLTPGNPYYIYDGWNPLGAVLTSGTYSGADVTITMPTVYAVPVGGWRWGSAPTRSKAFGVFVVRKTSSWVAPP